MAQNQQHLIENEQQNIENASKTSFITVLVSTFSTIFIAELGDKTQIATLILSAQSGKPFVVFLGAAIALICSSLVGVLLGRWIAKTFPVQKFTLSAGLLMIGLGIWLGYEGIHDYLQNQLII